MLHLLLIALHATSGIVALAAGIFVLRSPGRASPAMFGIYLGALWGMVLSLAVAVAAGWPSLNASSRTLFGALTLFAVAIGARGWASYRLARQRVPGWEHRSLENVGFTLIALFDGFVIVSALDLGAPVWLIVLAGAGGVLGGRFVIGRVRERLLPSTGTDTAARGVHAHRERNDRQMNNPLTTASTPTGQGIHAGRTTADLPDGAVIFLIGMRINRPLLVHRWLPAFRAMPRMIQELAKQPERGFLGATTWLSGRNVMVQQYWRCMDDLLAYARDRDAEHLPAWRAFNRRVGNDGTVGIWHEAYPVHAAESHVVYRNMPPFGLGAAVGRIPARPAGVPKPDQRVTAPEPAVVAGGR